MRNEEGDFDLYFRPGVSGTTYWAWIEVLPAGQTISLPVSRFASPQGFFTGGSRADTDQDGLTDGFELLVSKTNPTNPDSAVDQNSDPDGDNLPYAAEWKLRTNPNVADNPLTLNNLSDNQQISGTGYVNLNISSLVPSSTTFSLVVDDVVSPDASVEKNGHQWRLVWDTNSTFNGAYTIQLQMQYLLEGDNWGIVRGPAKNVNIGNNLTFGQFFNDEFRPSSLSSVIGSKLIIDAIINNYDESNSPNLAIAFYDEDDVYLGYTIHSPRSFIDQDGNSNWYISSEWDLTTSNSTLPSNKNIVGVFYWILTAQLDHNNTPQEITRRVFVRDGGLFDGDDFVVAWGWSPTFWEGRRPMQKHEMIRGGVLNTIGDPLGNLFNRDYVPYTLAPLPENRVVTSAGASNLPTFRFQTGDDKQKLLTALADRKNRNFFFLGHGSPGSLSHSSSEREQIYIPNANQPDVIFAEEIAQALGNPINPPWFFPNDRTKFINHPYRLVILMGCETAGPSWPNAFGISPKESTVQEYLDLGREPRAIVLWEEEILIPRELIPGRSQVLHSRFGYGLYRMFKFWMEGKTIEECMVEFERAANRTTVEEDGGRLGIRFSASELFDPFDGLDSWKIYGCKDLRRTKQ